MPPDEIAAAPADVLLTLISGRLDACGHGQEPDVARLVAEIHRRHPGKVAAVVLYGSYLRGKRDTLLDFYVLLDDLSTLPRRWQRLGNRALPPNVYYLSLPEDAAGAAVRAKYATMTLAQFEAAMGRFHSYFWSRFTQPAGLAWSAGSEARSRVAAAVAVAVHGFAARVAPTLPAEFSSEAFWNGGFALTYACELRSERPHGVATLYAHWGEHFDALLTAYAAQNGAAAVRTPQGAFRARHPDRRGAARAGWAVRRVQGKVLSVLRLVKAAGTFDDPLDYLLWKIRRHSGIYIEPTTRQRRHPLLFAWPLLWRLYRRGAFR